jgi:hypothetical protein
MFNKDRATYATENFLCGKREGGQREIPWYVKLGPNLEWLKRISYLERWTEGIEREIG